MSKVSIYGIEGAVTLRPRICLQGMLIIDENKIVECTVSTSSRNRRGSVNSAFRASDSLSVPRTWYVNIELGCHHKRNYLTKGKALITPAFIKGKSCLAAGSIGVGQKFLNGQFDAAFGNIFPFFRVFTRTTPPPHLLRCPVPYP